MKRIFNKRKRSRKAKEAQAEYLIKISSTLFTAFFIAILIVPITVIMKSAFDSNIANQSIYTMFQNIGFIKIALFLFCEVCLFYISDTFRERAYDIYDQLCPDRFNNRRKE